MKTVSVARFVAVGLLSLSLAGCLAGKARPVYDDRNLIIDKMDAAYLSNESRDNMTHIDPRDAGQKVPFFVEALRQAERDGHSGLGGDRAVATFSYLKEKSWRGYQVEFEGSYFNVGSIAV